MSHLVSTSVVVAIIYLRVSTEEQGRKGFSIPEQRRECMAKAEELAKERGAKLQVYEFLDMVSADWLERPELDRVRAFMSVNHVDYFVCLDPDRFSRNLVNQLLVDGEIRRHGVEPVYVSGNYANTPEGQFFFSVRGAASQYDRALIIRRTTRGKQGKIRSGGIPHQFRPFGYRYIKGIRGDSKDLCPLEINEEEAKWVRLMFQWAAKDRMNCQQIADHLTDLGVPTPRGRSSQWHRSTVAGILRNTVYYGQAALNKIDARGIQSLRQFPKAYRRSKYEALMKSGRREEAEKFLLTFRKRPKEDWVFVPVPAIVDRTLWEEVQAWLDTHSKQRSGLESRELSGFGLCGLCGGPLHYGMKNRRGVEYMLCSRSNLGPKHPEWCSLTRKQVRQIHERVWEEVTAWFLIPGRIEAAAARAGLAGSRAGSVDAPTSTAEISALKDQLAAKVQERERWATMWARDLIPAEQAEAKLKEVKQSIQVIEERIRAVEERQAAQSPRRIAAGVSDVIAELRAEAPDLLATAGPLQRREIYEAVLGRFILHQSPPGTPPTITCEPKTE